MKNINDYDTKSVPGTPPGSKGNQPKSKSKPLNLNDPSDLNYVH